MPEFRVEEDPTYGITHKVGAITLEAGVRGPELERELHQAREVFLKVMEGRGLILYKDLENNPRWIKNPDGTEAAWYAIDWDRRYKISRRTAMVSGPGGPEEIDLPPLRAMSLEDSEGEVEYRIAGVFWARKQQIEILRDKDEMLEEERLARNPVVFGSTGTDTERDYHGYY